MKNEEQYYRISQTQMSIARHYGGMNMNNEHYMHLPLSDRLVSDKAMKKNKELNKEVKAEMQVFNTMMKMGDAEFELAANKYKKEFYEKLNAF